MLTSKFLLWGLQVDLGTGLAIGALPGLLQNTAPILDPNSSYLHPFNVTLGDPPDPRDVLWAHGSYLTTFRSYSEPSLPSNSLRSFVDQAVYSLHDLKRMNHAESDDPIPGGVFQYQSETLSPLTIEFRLASYPPGADTLTYYEAGGVIASLAPYMRKWMTTAPASAVLELWERDQAMSEQKAAGSITGSQRRLVNKYV